MRARLPRHDRLVLRPPNGPWRAAAAIPGGVEGHDVAWADPDRLATAICLPAAANRVGAPRPAAPPGDPALGYESLRRPESDDETRDCHPRPRIRRKMPAERRSLQASHRRGA